MLGCSASLLIPASGHGGVIVQMGSVASVATMRVSNAPLYAASKHGILALVRSHGPHMHQRSGQLLI